MTRYSLVICTRNRRASLLRTLDSIGPAVLGRADVELVIVDNGSTDGTAEAARAAGADLACPARVVVHDSPGLSRARNAGVAAASGEWVVFTDDDCLLEPDHFDVLSHHVDALPVDIIGGRIVAHDERSALVALHLDPEFRFFVPGRPVHAGQIQGANLVVRRGLVERLGGFDERLGAGTDFRCEDIEFVGRALAVGARAAHVPRLVVRHDHRRAGADVTEIERANDVARGAFFAIRILAGDRAYARAWFRSLRGRLGRHPKHAVRAAGIGRRELSGAIAWVRFVRSAS